MRHILTFTVSSVEYRVYASPNRLRIWNRNTQQRMDIRGLALVPLRTAYRAGQAAFKAACVAIVG